LTEVYQFCFVAGMAQKTCLYYVIPAAEVDLGHSCFLPRPFQCIIHHHLAIWHKVCVIDSGTK